MSQLKYDKVNYKYRLNEGFWQVLPVRLARVIEPGKLNSFILLTWNPAGVPAIVVSAGYAWDGPSGPTIDTENVMRAALIHDVLYQAMRIGAMPRTWIWRLRVDKLFRRHLKEDGVPRWRRWIWYKIVRWRGWGSTRERHY